KARRQTVRPEHDLDVDARLPEKPDPLLDHAVGDPARVGKRRQPRLDDLPFTRAVRLTVRDANDRVDPGIVGKHLRAPAGLLEPPDDALPRAVEDPDDGPRDPLVPCVAAARPGTLLAGQNRVSAHAGARDEEIRASVDENESESFGAHRDAPRNLIRELDRRVFLAANPHDIAPPFERSEQLAERLFVVVGDVELPRELSEREDPGSLLAEPIEDLRIARQHFRQCIRRSRYNFRARFIERSGARARRSRTTLTKGSLKRSARGVRVAGARGGRGSSSPGIRAAERWPNRSSATKNRPTRDWRSTAKRSSAPISPSARWKRSSSSTRR